MIYRTNKGKYVTGKKVYNPKAYHVRSPGGSVRAIKNTSVTVPSPIRPKARAARAPRPRVSPLSPIGLAAMKIMVRKRRSNAGKKRMTRLLAALPRL